MVVAEVIDGKKPSLKKSDGQNKKAIAELLSDYLKVVEILVIFQPLPVLLMFALLTLVNSGYFISTLATAKLALLSNKAYLVSYCCVTPSVFFRSRKN